MLTDHMVLEISSPGHTHFSFNKLINWHCGFIIPLVSYQPEEALLWGLPILGGPQ